MNDMFEFSVFADEPLSTKSGVRLQESVGFDFQHKCEPTIGINPLSKSVILPVGLEHFDLDIHITIEDIGLNVRRHIFKTSLTDITEKKTINVDPYQVLWISNA
jgi:hypothetical protein